MRTKLRSASHELKNLAHRLSLLRENLPKELPAGESRSEADDLLGDTAERLRGIAEDLNGLSAAKG